MDILSLLKGEPKIVPGKIKPMVLLVLDGWGIAPASAGNAIHLAKKPNFDALLASYPHGELLAAGESVGLPASEVGNTEVGHLNLGAGRLVLQDLKRINKAIEEGYFFENQALAESAEHVIKNNSSLHVMGLVGRGNVHSSMNHLWAILEFCKRRAIRSVYLHLFTDGRDSPPKDAQILMQEIEAKLKEVGVGQIATVAGRYYAMDRDRRWERTRFAYDALVMGRGKIFATADQAISASYQAGKNDEFVEPAIVRSEGIIHDGDAVIFFNYRIDRPRQLTMAFVMPDFENLKSFEFEKDPEKGGRKEGEVKFSQTFERGKKLTNLLFVTMTEYDKKIPVSAIAYPPEVIDKSLPQVISEAGQTQLHLSESEKERFVTYYFDGLREGKFPGEEVLIVPSPKVPTYDRRPEMSVRQLVREFKNELAKDKFHFFILNFANPDMVAHTGNLEATIKAIEHTDRAVGEMAQAVSEAQGSLIITADHGNAEELLSYEAGSFFFTTSSGNVNTEHSSSPVPLVIINERLKGQLKPLPRGGLGDVAPTILGLMNIPVPSQMTGRNLLNIK